MNTLVPSECEYEFGSFYIRTAELYATTTNNCVTWLITVTSRPFTFTFAPKKTPPPMSHSANKKAKEIKALPLSETLRDLALLRASEVDLAGLLPPEAVSGDQGGKDYKGNQAVAESAEFIAEARKAIRLHDRGDVEGQGKKVEEVRKAYEELLEGVKE
jgi:hypothetical protein